MGMSHDLETAIEEGATCVRVGTALFGTRQKRVTVGFYSPLPPARTGVADYAAALLAELRRHGRVEIAPAPLRRGALSPGQQPLHAAIYRRALERPGVVVLHDAVLHHFLLGQLDEAAYIEEFVYNYGEWNRALARELWRGRAASGADPPLFRVPHAAPRRRSAPWPWWCTIRPPRAMVRAPRAARARRRDPAPFRSRRPLPADAETMRYRQRLGVPPGRVSVRRFRLPARIQAR